MHNFNIYIKIQNTLNDYLSLTNYVIISFNFQLKINRYSIQMSQTIKDLVRNRIQIHQKLVGYFDSDSDNLSCQFQQLLNLSKPSDPEKVQSEDKQIDEHKTMNERRKKVLQNLQYMSKQNISPKIRKEQRPLKIKKASQKCSQVQSKQIVELKSKLAQLIKQSQKKAQKISQLETAASLLKIQLQNLQKIISQKESVIASKQQQISSQNLQKTKLTQHYELSLKSYDIQYNNRLNQLNQQIFQLNQSSLQKDRQIGLLTNLVKLKDQQLNQSKKKEDKASKCIKQNQKLKSDLQRLLSLLEINVKQSTLSKSQRNVLQEKLSPFKPKRSRSKSLIAQNMFMSSKNKTPKTLSRCFNPNYSSLLSNAHKNKTIQSDWYPIDLINQVELFLKRWRIAQNNPKFVSSLVNFIHAYTETCVNQNKSIMDNQYKSLKKEIKRKANQSLILSEIIKERELKIKMNASSNQIISSKIKSKPKNQDLYISSENVSILIPASNKKINQARTNNFISASLLNDKHQKEDCGYINLEQSIKLHRKTSPLIIQTHQIDLQSISIKPQIKNKRASTDQRHKKSKTQWSLVKQGKREAKKSSNTKRSMSQKRSYDFPLKKYKIV